MSIEFISSLIGIFGGPLLVIQYWGFIKGKTENLIEKFRELGIIRYKAKELDYNKIRSAKDNTAVIKLKRVFWLKRGDNPIGADETEVLVNHTLRKMSKAERKHVYKNYKKDS